MTGTSLPSSPPLSGMPEAEPAHWRGINNPDDPDRGICIYSISPWPPVKNVRGTTRLVAQHLSFADADRILQAVGGEWA